VKYFTQAQNFNGTISHCLYAQAVTKLSILRCAGSLGQTQFDQLKDASSSHWSAARLRGRFGGDWERVDMPTFSPELIQIMRALLEEAMTRVPLEQRTPGIKAHLAECILKAAAQGETSYEGLMAAAADQLQTVLSMLI
jgi:hypothetical protein